MIKKNIVLNIQRQKKDNITATKKWVMLFFVEVLSIELLPLSLRLEVGVSSPKMMKKKREGLMNYIDFV